MSDFLPFTKDDLDDGKAMSDMYAPPAWWTDFCAWQRDHQGLSFEDYENDRVRRGLGRISQRLADLMAREDDE